MTVPEDFVGAYEGLVELVRRIASGEVREEVLREEVDAWRREDCRGAAALTKAAALSLRYELASRGLGEGSDAVSEDLRALGRVEAVVEPPEAAAQGVRAEIVEVALPEQLRQSVPGARGFRMGRVQMMFEATPANAHLSVSHPERYPTWEELLLARTAPGGTTPNLWAWLPKPGESPGANPYTVHLWVAPPEEFLG